MANGRLTIALDATYSVGRNLSGVGVYSREILNGLAGAHTDVKFLHCYRPHRFLRGLKEPKAPNAGRRLLWNGSPASLDLFHGLNQRLDRRYRRSVATFHDLFVMTGEYSTADFRQRFAQQARDAASRADIIITVSNYTAAQVQQLLNVERSRIRVIPHGVRAPQAFRKIERERMILFAGAIQTRKNVRRLIEAFAQTPQDWKLILVGSSGYGAEAIFEALESSVRRKDITVTGYVTDSELENLYQRASIFAFPSLDEGFGIPVLEAMARGVPVLTSTRSALPEVAGDAALLVDPENAGEIANGLNALIEDDNLRSELVQKGLRRSAEYTWTRAVNATWNVYQELLSN